MFHRVKSEVSESDQKENQAPATGVYKREQPQRTPYSSMRNQPERYEAADEDTEVAQQDEEETAEDVKQTEEVEETLKQPRNETTQTGYKRMTQQSEQLSSPTLRPHTPYSAGSSYIPPHGPESIATAGERCLTIGRGINMSGEIESCDHLLVEGTVEAALKGAKVLEVAESGVFYGTVEIEEATIAGRFEGDITVSGRLTLHASAVITGSIAYRELEVEAGAVIDGRMTPMKGAVDEKAVEKYRAGSEASAMAKPTVSAPKKPRPANNESGLFTKVNTQY